MEAQNCKAMRVEKWEVWTWFGQGFTMLNTISHIIHMLNAMVITQVLYIIFAKCTRDLQEQNLEKNYCKIM